MISTIIKSTIIWKTDVLIGDIVDEFIANKWLYQEKAHHNLVFVSYKNEKPVFMTEKGIIQESRFMKEYPGQ